MRYRLLYSILILLSFVTAVYSQNYYWYNGNKISLQQGDKWYILYKEDNNLNREESQNNVSTPSLSLAKFMCEIGVDKTTYNTKNIVYQTPSFLCFDGTQDMYVTHRFYVKLKQTEDFDLLQNLAEQYHIEIEQDVDLPLWYIISCSENSQYNALELANIFYETELFAASEPEFIGALQVDCVNDVMFNQQWNLRNTGQYGSNYSGIDINYCRANAITQGDSSVIIGVYDLGVDLTHPDINHHSFSYDAYTESSPSQIYADKGKIYHGTACAGIIGAITNNSIGVAGIAPNCPIMSLSINYSSTSPEKLKKGFITAANNGCYVISNSWRWGTPSLFTNDGISYALSHGRNGKGCVVVFSAGNDNKDGANYPANSNDSIIVVGAMSPCGERKNFTSCDGEYWWGSNYGNKVDVMAPGVKIRTADNVGNAGKTSTNYMSDFNGTSAACPHVAAIAGLILSVNPNLTMKEVSDIIESTAQKVGEYDYTITEGRPNGTWNDSVGYGLVDAYAAVLAAKTKYIQNHTYQSGSVIVETYPEIIAGYAVTDNKPYGNVTLEAGSDVTFSATEQVVLKPGFHAKAGSNLHIKIEAPTANIASAPQRIAANTSSEDTDSTNERVTNNGLENAENEVIISTSIYTVSGQLIQTITGDQHDATHLPNGMYILQHRMSDGSMRSEKIANNK